MVLAEQVAVGVAEVGARHDFGNALVDRLFEEGWNRRIHRRRRVVVHGCAQVMMARVRVVVAVLVVNVGARRFGRGAAVANAAAANVDVGCGRWIRNRQHDDGIVAGHVERCRRRHGCNGDKNGKKRWKMAKSERKEKKGRMSTQSDRSPPSFPRTAFQRSLKNPKSARERSRETTPRQAKSRQAKNQASTRETNFCS